MSGTRCDSCRWRCSDTMIACSAPTWTGRHGSSATKMWASSPRPRRCDRSGTTRPNSTPWSAAELDQYQAGCRRCRAGISARSRRAWRRGDGPSRARLGDARQRPKQRPGAMAAPAWKTAARSTLSCAARWRANQKTVAETCGITRGKCARCPTRRKLSTASTRRCRLTLLCQID